MKGEVHVEIQNKRIRFEFDLRRNITVIRGDSATGKTTLISMIDAYANNGAAFGSEMGELFLYVQRHPEVYLYLPESFEWIILASGLIDGNYVSNILEKPMDYIESRDFFSWEQFFTKLLIQETKDTYLQYSKHKLNNAYLNQKEKKAILEVLGIIRGLLGCNAE